MCVQELIQRLGGPAAIGRRLGIRSQAVSLWLSQRRVPLERVPQLLELASELGLTMQAADLRPDYDWAAVCASAQCKAAR